jgi:hypothetical protein
VTPEDEQLLDQFEKAWQTDQTPALELIASRVAPDTLRELVLLDLEYRWRSYQESTSDWLGPDQPPSVEEYVAQYPALALDDELIAEEYRARQTWGDRPSPEDYLQRFADRPHLPELLEEIEAELIRESVVAGITLQPAASANLSAASLFETVGEYQLLGHRRWSNWHSL